MFIIFNSLSSIDWRILYYPIKEPFKKYVTFREREGGGSTKCHMKILVLNQPNLSLFWMIMKSKCLAWLHLIGFLRHLFLVHFYSSKNKTLKIIELEMKICHTGASEKSRKKVSRIIWMAPRWILVIWSLFHLRFREYAIENIFPCLQIFSIVAFLFNTSLFLES